MKQETHGFNTATSLVAGAQYRSVADKKSQADGMLGQESHAKGAPGKSTIFPPDTWEADRKVRYELPWLTGLTHRSVPVLGYLHWTIEEIKRGFAVTRLPLNVETSNQYITQQAALMLLSADYTGGIALSTLFKETPVIGFHPQNTDYGAYLWGAAATIKWLRPSTDDLFCKSTIPERDWDRIAIAFERGEEVNYKARIKMYNGTRKIVAVSDFHYWARSSHSLRATSSTLDGTHHMLAHKLATSARLIAGLRSWIEVGSGAPLDPYASRTAGAQGLAMAKKFSVDTPQLAELVRARTENCDDALLSFSRRNREFVVVNIGCGYDSRPWRMSGLGGAAFVCLDLPVMIRDRREVLPAASESEYRVVESDYDILNDDLAATLRRLDVPEHVPMFFIWEGGSMYFGTKQANGLLRQIRELMCSSSELWFDFVSASGVSDSSGLPGVKQFMDSMRAVGEPFIRGFDNCHDEIASLGLKAIRTTSAAQLLESSDPVLGHYSFALCAAADGGK
jgi:O-methyltransferase involved in polyketide biosynthesis